MSFAPYIFRRFFFRISDFFSHWYVDGSRAFWHRFVSFFESLDQVFAFKITLRYFWKPLYGDYTIVGRIMGFFLRLGRLCVGGVTYVVCAVLMLAVYAAWIALPPTILFIAYHNYVTRVP